MFTSFVALAAAITRDDPGRDRPRLLVARRLGDCTRPGPMRGSPRPVTDLNGQRLAAALGQVVAPDFAGAGGRVHLIGHGHGAKVATVAAIALERPPDQLTLLDSPETVLASLPGAANHLEGYLPLLPIGRGTGKTFVDSYFSIAGERYGTLPALEAVVDVKLDPAQYGDLQPSTTSSPATAIRSTGTRSQPKTSAAGVGFAWSPPIGRPPRCIACYFRPGLGRLGEVDGRRAAAPTGAGHRARRPSSGGRSRCSRSEGRPRRCGRTGWCSSAPGHRLWQVTFDRDPDDLAIEFDDRFTALAPMAPSSRSGSTTGRS